jgi:large subunit ribosomal protein L22
MKAYLKNYRQAPRKVRLVTDMVKGKKVPEALAALSYLPKRASLPMKKLIESASKNAENLGMKKENLYIKDIRVDKGMVFKRIMPRARGRGALIRRESSHVSISLAEGNPPKTGRNAPKKVVAATA